MRFDVDDTEHGEIVKLVSLALVRENGETKRAALLQAILDKADGVEVRHPEIGQEDKSPRDRASYGLLLWIAVFIMIGLGAGLLGGWIAGLSAILGRGPC